MGNQFEIDAEEEARHERRKQRIAEMKKQKEHREQLREKIKKYGGYGIGVLVTIVIIGLSVSLVQKDTEAKENESSLQSTTETGAVASGQSTEQLTLLEEGAPDTQAEDIPASMMEASVQESEGIAEQSEESCVITPTDIIVGDVTFKAGYTAETTEDTVTPAEDVLSEYAILMDVSNGTIVAQKNVETIINPASMTKILTVLVAAEHVTNLDDTFTMTLDITDYAYTNDCSSVGFLDCEVVTVRDLFYGTILPSGGDAAVALATYVSGSQEAFVELMNEKLEELGLADTAHFTNCVGLYDEDHYCSVYDMAMIMKAAAENELCREVMSTRVYTTSITEQHPEGITVSNWFIRRIEDKDTAGKVICAKTGFVNQSGSCAASYYISEEGTPYICVTAQTYSSWRCIYDHVALYKKYTPD